MNCAKAIQHYFRAYSARVIADNGNCEVYPTLSAKYFVFFDPPGSGIMKMSLKGVAVYLNGGKGMMKRHVVKTFARVEVEEESAKKIHRVCRRYRVRMKMFKI